MTVDQRFAQLPSLYRKGHLDRDISYYFSIGDAKYTVFLTPQTCRVEPGQSAERADVVLKTTPALFEKMVIHGKTPGPLDIAMGRVKTNNPGALKQLRDCFDFSSWR